ncbi:MAG TPA: A24 family peptidase [Treponemataceae bacterium]|nr:A24 family peptidase [Treponemataceae bacterium]
MNNWKELVLLFIFLAFSIPAAIIDLREYRLPDRLTLPLFFLLALWIALTNLRALPFSLMAAAVAAVFFLFIRFTTKGLGLGDVKLALCIGLFCGPWLTIFAFLLASFTGLFVALFLVLRGKLVKHQKIPFGPFLVFGAIAAWVVGFIW